MLTIAKLKRWSINYYNDTARAASAATDAQRAGGGLGEYYSESETRAPVWCVAGDVDRAAMLVGLGTAARSGGAADPDVVQRWLDDGVSPNGALGRQFGQAGVHGFDLTFCAPKSVSLLRAVGQGGVAAKAVADAHAGALAEAMKYLSEHAGYSRIHNAATGQKDLVRLPGIVAVTYQHETSRGGDPHLHTHVIVPNRQARGDGRLVSIDGTSLYHEARAAGVIYQATLRRELTSSLGIEWAPGDPHTGMAEVAGVDPKDIRAWSQRSTQLREWAALHLAVADGGGQLSAAQLGIAQKATRPSKPEHVAWPELLRTWAADPRGFSIDVTAQSAARMSRLAAQPDALAAARAAVADITNPAFTRADLIEAIAARMPITDDAAPGTVRTQVEALADRVAVRITATREPHQREGHDRYTAAPILAEEAAVLALMAARSQSAAFTVTTADTAGLSPDQASAVSNIAASPWLIQPLSAPAGAGKTTSLRALREAAHRGSRGRQILLLAPTGKAVDVAVREGAGDAGCTLAKALKDLRDGTITFDSQTVVVVDEAGMAGTQHLRELLTATTHAGAKAVLVGDPYQLAPVKARGGMFEQLCVDLPWSQRLSEVWRMRDPAERSMSLALRDGGPTARRRAVDWYHRHDRLRTGDPIAMSIDALAAWRSDIADGKDALLIADTWEVCDALNSRIHNEDLAKNAPRVTAARGHRITAGDVVITRRNDPSIEVRDASDLDRSADPVRNGHRWRVLAVDPERDRIAAQRISDGARTVFESAYLHEHVHHGYAVTVHAAQGVTADTTHALLGQAVDRATAYVALTRAREANTAYLYEKIAGENDHEHAEVTLGVHTSRRGTGREAAVLLRAILGRDARPQTVIATASDADRAVLPLRVRELLERHRRTRAACVAAQRKWREAAAPGRDASHRRVPSRGYDVAANRSPVQTDLDRGGSSLDL